MINTANKRQKKKNQNKGSPISVSEVRARHEKDEKSRALFESAQEALKFLDLTKTETRSFKIYNKENLRAYMKNPKSNEANLRNLSRFLYRVSHPYRRLLRHNAEMVDLTAQSIIPLRDITKKSSSTKILKNYYNTCVQVEKMALDREIYKCLIVAWREDSFYGYVYEDDEGFFIMPLDGDFCKISSANDDGTFNFAFDFTYFRTHPELLEYWDNEFSEKYNIYQSDTSQRWQELEPEKVLCLKVNNEDPTLCLPPYIGLFEQCIDLIDLQSIQSVKENLSIYKLIVAKIPTISGSKDADDFAVDINTALKYYQKLEESLPPEITAAVSPLPLDTIEFKGTTPDEGDAISSSMSNLFNISGGSLILDSAKKGASVYEAQIIADTINALVPLLPQVEAWMNRYLTYIMGDHAKIKYIKVSPYTKKQKRKEIIESAQYGVPVKLALAALDGFSPLEALSLQYIENDCLSLHSDWIPLQSSYTMSGTAGGQEKDVSDLTDEGDKTREQGKNGG